jgi:LEA14-like dessication related protein
MSRLWISFTVALALALPLAAGCHPGRPPELRVLGVNDVVAHEVVFVQVTNPASQPMRLTKLEYTFAADGATVSTGEMPLERDVPAGAAVVVEVPLVGDSSRAMTLQGVLTAELDQIVRTFQVQAQIRPH